MCVNPIPPAWVRPPAKERLQRFAVRLEALGLGQLEIMELVLERFEGALALTAGVKVGELGGGEGVCPGEVLKLGGLDLGRYVLVWFWHAPSQDGRQHQCDGEEGRSLHCEVLSLGHGDKTSYIGLVNEQQYTDLTIHKFFCQVGHCYMG